MTRAQTRLPRLALATALATALAGGLAITAAAPALSWQDSAPASAAAAADADRLAAPDGPIRLRGINGYAVLDRQHLVLRAGASRRYLVTLKRRCFGLRSGHSIGLSVRSHSTIHNPHFEYIQTGQERCYFDTIEEVDSNDQARALIAARAEAAAAAEAQADANSMR
ncbi:DUF6491 family protein [Maricaulis sp.]|uniref:DUF6491 family protein n=1 Tax=Maricaulis sp. TaxID=1486257 RepID=UPI002B2682D6|nr:DUF6491 family protein [Maricaulis sp.]